MEVRDAVREPALIEQLELRPDAVRQGALAASHHDRAQEQVALVDQPRSEGLAGGSAPPTAMSAPADCLRRRTASGSNSRSIRVRALVTVSSDREYTTFSADRQISA